MRKIFFLILTIFFLNTGGIYANEKILNYEVKISVQENSSLEIEEKIVYDFTKNAHDRHGIYRYIPYYYEDNMLEYEIISVSEKYTTYEENKNFVLKIGDPDINVSGVKEYTLKYLITPGIFFENEYPKFNWNVIGHNWNIPIEKAIVSIQFPSEFQPTDYPKCWTGEIGSLHSNCEIIFNEGKFFVRNTSVLSEREGMTVEIKMPKGVIVPPGKIVVLNDIGKVLINNQTYSDLPRNIYLSPNKYLIEWERFGFKNQKENLNVSSGEEIILNFHEEKYSWFVFFQYLPYFFIPFSTYIVYLSWKKFGKDIGDKGSIVVEFNPPKDMTPIEMGILNTTQFKTKYVAATIIHFAIQGFLKIVYDDEGKKQKYFLKKIKDAKEPLRKYEIDLFNNLFSYSDSEGMVDINEIKNKFYVHIEKTKKDSWNEILKKKIWTRNPQTSQGVAAGIGAVFLILGVTIGTIYYYIFLNFSFIVWIVLTTLAIFILTAYIQQKTELGSDLYRHIQGLKIYLNVAEKERIKFHNAPSKSPEQFEKLLPFAVVLGVEKEWADAFKDIYKTPPDWYEGGNMRTFNSVLLVSSLSNFNSSVARSVSTSPSSSSGGSFSGGGGGGGGGGSW